jgi:hypothetical protein
LEEIAAYYEIDVEHAKHIILNIFDGAKEPIHFAYSVFTKKNEDVPLHKFEEEFKKVSETPVCPVLVQLNEEHSLYRKAVMQNIDQDVIDKVTEFLKTVQL